MIHDLKHIWLGMWSGWMFCMLTNGIYLGNNAKSFIGFAVVYIVLLLLERGWRFRIQRVRDGE
jgi:hypothetical protein